MQEDLISVIVPVYKVENFLKRCVDSIINQTYRNLEIILVDDGSPDNCGRICDEYQKRDSRVRVIHKDNGGLSDARNAGIEIATGQFLGFVDSDDYIAPDMYEHLYSILVNNNADISVCSASIVQEGGRPEYTDDEKILVFHGQGILYSLVYEKKFTVNKLYKRQVFDGVEFPVGMLYEDLATTYRLMEQANTIVVSFAKKYAYVQRNGSIMNQTAFKMKTDKIAIIDEMWKHFSQKNRPQKKELLAGVIMYIINDIFKMMGRKKLENNPEYRECLSKFVKKKCLLIFANRYISLYNRFVLAFYILNPKLLAYVYRIKSRGDKK